MREDELQHFDNPLKGIMREGHKYLERLGEPGNYTYIYDNVKKVANDVTKRVNDAGKEVEKSTKQTAKIVMDAVEKTATKLCTDGKNYTDAFRSIPLAKTVQDTSKTIGNLIFNKKSVEKLDPKERDVSFVSHQRKDVKEVNDDGIVSIFVGRQGRTTNCAYCTLAWDLRRRGYDVQAKQDSRGGLVADQIEKLYRNPDGTTPNFETASNRQFGGSSSTMSEERFHDMYDTLVSQGEGARGQLCGFYFAGGGHSMGYEIVDGRLMIVDGQSGKVYYGTKLSDFNGCSVQYMRQTIYLRTDDKQINENAVYNYVENAERGTYHTKTGSDREIATEHTINLASGFLAKFTSRAIFGILLDNSYCREEIFKGYNKLLKGSK